MREDLRRRVRIRPTMMPEIKLELKRTVKINPTKNPFAKCVFECGSEAIIIGLRKSQMEVQRLKVSLVQCIEDVQGLPLKE